MMGLPGIARFTDPRFLSRRLLTGLALVIPGVWGLGGCSGGTDEGSPSTGGTGTTQTGGAGGGDISGTGGSSTGGNTVGAGGAGSGGDPVSGGATSAGGAEGSGSSSSSGGAETDGTGGIDAGSGGESATGGTESGTGGSENDPLSPGCGTAFSSPPPSNQQQSLEIAGDTRYYLMDVPDGADNETPLMLVFGLHGFDMNNIAVVDLFNFTERSGGQAITVWPQGEGPHPGDVSHWGDQVLQSTWSANEQNYAFLRQIIDDLGERYCIDQERIFIAGFSMGAFFTNQLACAHSDWFRGFAPVAGGAPQSCASSEIQSAIMVQHGTADDIVVLSSGEASRDFWLNQNGCGSTSTSSLNNCAFYDGCPDDKPVAWCTGSYDHYIPDEVASNIWSFFSSL
jgi:poly(3-hydroxybutyrate) depolymerase